MGKIRKAAVAGMFYPSEKKELSAMVATYISDSIPEKFPRALIVPHAGYIYSGSTAGTGYSAIKGIKAENILLLGPAHRTFFRGLAVPDSSQFETPLGRVNLNQKIIDKILKLPFVEINNDAHKNEHCLEVQLPFLQNILSDFSIIPVLAGDIEIENIVNFLEQIEQDLDLIIISSDLSHYNSYEEAGILDRAASESIENLDPDTIRSAQACGFKPVKALLTYARKKGLEAKTLMLKNSGDTSGDKKSVVGYGAYAFFNRS